MVFSIEMMAIYHPNEDNHTPLALPHTTIGFRHCTGGVVGGDCVWWNVSAGCVSVIEMVGHHPNAEHRKPLALPHMTIGFRHM